MDLARELGMTLKQLDENLEPGELEHWIAYFRKRVFSQDAGWSQFASLMRALTTIFSKKGQRVPSLQDFIPDMKFGGDHG